MNQNKILVTAAILGLAITIIAILFGHSTVTPSSPAVQAAKAPYGSYIAGAGLIESTTGNIAIGTPVSGIISDIYVKIGDHIEKGAPLFKIDDRDLQASLLLAIAKLSEAKAIVDKAKANLKIAEEINYQLAIHKKELLNRRADTVIFRAGVDVAKAEVEKIRIEMERRIIRAPLAGEILQIKTHLGEFAGASVSPLSPLMMLGGDSSLHVRVDIDEYDAWRFTPHQPATAFVRGYPLLKIPLTFVYLDPYVIPKKSLTGNSSERTDTRVLQVIYNFDQQAIPLYIGQQLDVYIKTPPVGNP